MEIYRVVQLSRDGMSGWTVERFAPGEKQKPYPRLLYRTKEAAQAEADRLAALEEKQES